MKRSWLDGKIGKRFGRIVITGVVWCKPSQKKHRERFAKIKCDCGTVGKMAPSNIKRGAKSCGCKSLVSRLTHGMTFTPTWQSWRGMIDRCKNPNARQYRNYGGRGIGVCKRWREFKAFFADMGERPDGTLIERINNDKGYSPSNCRWATNAEQSLNKRTNRVITVNGVSKPLMQWSRKTGIHHSTLWGRLSLGILGADLFRTRNMRHKSNTKKLNIRRR